MQLADAYKDLQIERAALQIELRDLRYSCGKFEDAIEQVLEEYDTSGGNADRMVQVLRDALLAP